MARNESGDPLLDHRHPAGSVFIDHFQDSLMDISQRDRIDLTGRKVTVIGLGRSGFAAARLAHHLGARVFVSDPADTEALRNRLDQLRSLGISGETGTHSDRIYTADLWILSPGVPKDTPQVQAALEKGIPVVGEVEFASWFTNAPLLAVTGSNGKTTTVHLLTAMCQTEQMHGIMAGNIGIPFSGEVLKELTRPDPGRVYVLEISSFQMEFITHFRPRVAVFLNITPDHLDRHPSMEDYIAAKLNMVKNQTSADFVVYNADDPILREAFQAPTATPIPFALSPVPEALYHLNRVRVYNPDREVMVDLEAIRLPGRHNLANLLAAATAAHLIGIPDEKIAQVFRTFTAVEHRLEPVTEIDGVTFVNDSKATNVDAVKVALDSYSRPIILILGGRDKGGDFRLLLPHTHNVKAVIAYGEARGKIVTALRDAVRLHPVGGLKEAVTLSRRLASPGDVVLLSPGCASFDQFDNYEQRGKRFKTWVRELAGKV
jgi:UDP-N-acetylmuramoylalanine--D-glutamate ligase